MRPPVSPATAPATAFAVAAAGIAVFSGMDAVMKGLTLAMGVYNAMLWRSAAGLVFGGLLVAWYRPAWPAFATVRVHIVRGLVSAVMALLFFWGLARVPMAQAIALTYIAPLIALFLAAWLLGETITRAAIAASLIAFAGVVVILVGQARAAMGPEALLGAAAIIASAICYSWNIILMRQQALLAGPVEIAFFQNMVVTGALLFAAPWLAAWPPVGQVPVLVFAAVLATASLALLSWAYARAEANLLAPSEYTAFIWASVLGWLVFGEHVSLFTLVGAALIVGGCLYAVRRGGQRVGDAEAAIP